MFKHDQLTPYRRFFIIMGIICLAAILVNLVLRRGPVEDAQAVEDLRNISGSIQSYYSNRSQLPGDLSDIRSELSDSTWARVDRYDYVVVGLNTYRLCATFNAASTNDSRYEAMPYPAPGNDDPGRHTKGRQCFQYSAENYGPGTVKPL